LAQKDFPEIDTSDDRLESMAVHIRLIDTDFWGLNHGEMAADTVSLLLAKTVLEHEDEEGEEE
jgi:hypothetical protein